MSYQRLEKKQKPNPFNAVVSHSKPRHREFPYRAPSPLMRSPGNTGMPEPVRAQMEAAFGTDFSNVTVHPNSTSALKLNALAYTQGHDIHVAPGVSDFHSPGGRDVLKHELAHVVQQREGRVRANGKRNGLPVNNEPALEREAHNMASGSARSRGHAHHQPTEVTGSSSVAQCLTFTTTKQGSRSRGNKITTHTLTDEMNTKQFLADYAEDSVVLGKGKEEVEASADPDLISSWNDGVEVLGYTNRLKISIKVDNTVFDDIEKEAITGRYGGAPFSNRRKAFGFISHIITTKIPNSAQVVYDHIFGNKERENALTQNVRPGSKHEHLMTSKVVERLLADLDETKRGKNTQAYSFDTMKKQNYSAWNLLDDTLSDTYQIVLHTTSYHPGDGETQDHHSTSKDRIAYYPGGDMTQKPTQAVGEGAGTSGYHNDLKKVAETKGLYPKDMAIELKDVNDKWLAEKSDITKVPANKRATQLYNVAGTMKHFNKAADLNDIGQKVGDERKDVLKQFDMVIHKLK